MRSVVTEGLEYHEWFDEYAEVHDMEPGDRPRRARGGPRGVANRGYRIDPTAPHGSRPIEPAPSGRA